MKSNRQSVLQAQAIRSAIFVLLVAVLPISQAQTIWNGPTTNWAPTKVYNKSDPSTYDLMTADVALARNSDYPLFNAKKESTYNNGLGSPQNTTWALGALSDLSTLIANNSFKKWGSVIGGGGTQAQLYKSLPGKTYVVHLVSDNIYLSVKFDTWNSDRNQSSSLYSYTRTTPAAVVVPPTVSITNPVNGAVFSAPANVSISASASVATGSVTNVAFFGGTNLLGSATTSPFGIIASNLAANTYSLTAVATAAGISATSTPVNISVVVPVALSNSAPQISNGLFSFNYSANASLSYVVQDSSDLVNWLPLITNVATGSSILATDAFLVSGQRFYRTVLQPNP
jgi:hypothetical protein